MFHWILRKVNGESMKWNNNFDMKKNVNGKNITVGMQNFDDMTILINV